MTDVVEALKECLGEDCVLTGEAVSDRASGIWRSDPIKAKAIIRPRNTEQVSQALDDAFTHGDHTRWVSMLLEWYYDPMYDYQLEKKRARVVFTGERQAVCAYLDEQELR